MKARTFAPPVITFQLFNHPRQPAVTAVQKEGKEKRTPPRPPCSGAGALRVLLGHSHSHRETQGPWGRRRVTSPDSGGLRNDRGGAAMCTAGGLEGGGVEAAPLHDGKGELSAVHAGGEEAT